MPDWLLKLPIWLQVHIRTLAAEMLELEGSAAYRRAKATPWDRAHERMRWTDTCLACYRAADRIRWPDGEVRLAQRPDERRQGERRQTAERRR